MYSFTKATTSSIVEQLIALAANSFISDFFIDLINFLWAKIDVADIENSSSPKPISNGAATVSYTHLDVYKRQGKYCIYSHNSGRL